MPVYHRCPLAPCDCPFTAYVYHPKNRTWATGFTSKTSPCPDFVVSYQLPDRPKSPFGMVLVGDDFYVADTDAIMKFPYSTGETKISAPGVKLADLPAGPLTYGSLFEVFPFDNKLVPVPLTGAQLRRLVLVDGEYAAQIASGLHRLVDREARNAARRRDAVPAEYLFRLVFVYFHRNLILSQSKW